MRASIGTAAIAATLPHPPKDAYGNRESAAKATAATIAPPANANVP